MKGILKRPGFLYRIILILLLGKVILGYQVLGIKKLEKAREAMS